MKKYKESIKNIIKIIYCIVFPLFMLKILYSHLDWPDVLPKQGPVFIATFCLTIAAIFNGLFYILFMQTSIKNFWFKLSVAICTLSAVGFLFYFFI